MRDEFCSRYIRHWSVFIIGRGDCGDLDGCTASPVIGKRGNCAASSTRTLWSRGWSRDLIRNTLGKHCQHRLDRICEPKSPIAGHMETKGHRRDRKESPAQVPVLAPIRSLYPMPGAAYSTASCFDVTSLPRNSSDCADCAHVHLEGDVMHGANDKHNKASWASAASGGRRHRPSEPMLSGFQVERAVPVCFRVPYLPQRDTRSHCELCREGKEHTSLCKLILWCSKHAPCYSAQRASPTSCSTPGRLHSASVASIR